MVRKQARVNGRSNHVSTSVDVAVWLEYTMNRVSDGARSTLLSFVSCGASQGYAPQSGEIIGILTVLFRYVGIGTRLALTSMGWLTVREFVILVPTHWITQDALLDMIDAIDADMHARPGDAELTPWLLVLDCAPQHIAAEFRSIMRDTRPHIKLCYVQRNFTGYTQPLDWAYMRAFKSSIRNEVAKHFAEFFLDVESNFERVNLDSSTAVLRQLLLSFVHTAAQNADSPQHRTAGWRFIDWNEVEQRELLAEAKRLLETGELFPRGTAEEPHAPDAEAEASDSEPEAHVMEPLADDHSSDSDDAPTGVEESAAPAAPAVAAAPKRAAMSLLRGCTQSVSYSVASHHRDSISASVSLAK